MRRIRTMLTIALLISPISSRRTEANGPPIHTENAFVTGLNGAALRSFYKEVRKSKLLQDGKKIADPMDRRMTVRMIPIAVPYEAVDNRLVVGVAAPYLNKRLDSTQSGVRTTLTNSGLGDLSLFGKFRLYQRDSGHQTTRVAGKLTLKLPTGKDNATDDAGTPLPLGLQLGTGSTDVSAGGVLMRLWKRWGINSALQYTVKTEANDVERGDTLGYDLALAYRVWPIVYETYPSPQWNLFLELNGLWEQKRKERGQPVADSGGNTVLLSPGIQFMGGRTWLLEFSYQVPIVQALNGTQLGTDHTFSAGFRWLIF